jgi:hypothetical protein
VPIVTYHAPQTKYSRNIIAESLIRIVEFIDSSVFGATKVGLRLACSRRANFSSAGLIANSWTDPPVALWRSVRQQRGRAGPTHPRAAQVPSPGPRPR